MIIGLVGNKRVGKDTCADYLCYTHNFKKYSFATYLKQALKILFDWDDASFNDDNKEVVDTFWNVTPRQMCQDLGSFLRNFNKNFHINRLDKDISKLGKLDNVNIVFSDIRYQNELDYVKSLGGIIIKINRNTVLNDFSNHESETSIDNLTGIDSYIINNGTLDILYSNLNNIILMNKLSK